MQSGADDGGTVGFDRTLGSSLDKCFFQASSNCQEDMLSCKKYGTNIHLYSNLSPRAPNIPMQAIIVIYIYVYMQA